jgi:CRP/FNR family transcriptional regulator, cyclic AMP receptor protein
MTFVAAPASCTWATNGLFAQCRPKELAAIDRLAIELAVAPGRVLLREGEPGRQFFVITAGRARVTVGRDYVDTVDAGSFLGEVSMMDGGPCMATVTAATPMHLLAFGRSEFRALMDLEIPSISHRMMHTMARRVRASGCDRHASKSTA